MPVYDFAYSDKALAFLESLKDVKLRRQIVTRIEALAKDPTPRGAKPLKGMADSGDRVYRVRQGKHRILYAVRNPIIVILDIDHRKGVYR